MHDIWNKQKQAEQAFRAVLETAEMARKQVGLVFPCDGEKK